MMAVPHCRRAVQRLGKGRLVWSATPWGNQYHARREERLGQWMRGALEWLLTQPLPVTMTASRQLHLAVSRVADGWLLYLINRGADGQERRRKWWEMMKVGDAPPALGTVEFNVSSGRQVELLYGAAPDRITVKRGMLRGVYENFTGHAVLHVLTQGVNR